MEDIFLTAKIDEERSMCISPLPKKTYKEGGKGLGGEFGYFIYETSSAGIEVIGKVASKEAALRLFQLLTSPIAKIA